MMPPLARVKMFICKTTAQHTQQTGSDGAACQPKPVGALAHDMHLVNIAELSLMA
jgi:hypothetical protein